MRRKKKSGGVMNAVEDANVALEALIEKHRQAAIPALLGVIVDWAVQNGGADTVRGSLLRAVTLADQLEADRRRSAN